MKNFKLPCFNERPGSIDTLVLHCLAFGVEDGIKSFHENQVSSHYMIDFNGRIYRLVDESNRAWHAGKSFWRGQDGLNNSSIGIEICHPNLGQTPYNRQQVWALIRLCQNIIRRYHIKPQNIVGHSDIAPSRKPDPGKAFPWEYLSRHGIGLWYNLKDAPKIQNQNPQELLAAIGYDTTDLTAAQWAFCRRFLPECVPGKEDIFALLNCPVPREFDLPIEKYLPVLKAVAWKYK